MCAAIIPELLSYCFLFPSFALSYWNYLENACLYGKQWSYFHSYNRTSLLKYLFYHVTAQDFCLRLELLWDLKENFLLWFAATNCCFEIQYIHLRLHKLSFHWIFSEYSDLDLFASPHTISATQYINLCLLSALTRHTYRTTVRLVWLLATGLHSSIAEAPAFSRPTIFLPKPNKEHNSLFKYKDNKAMKKLSFPKSSSIQVGFDFSESFWEGLEPKLCSCKYCKAQQETEVQLEKNNEVNEITKTVRTLRNKEGKKI